jgi:hypothetical protein
MFTYSGRSVFPVGNKYGYPSDDAPSIKDIGVALGRIPRFAGHTKHWYPVLCHVLVCEQFVDPGFGVYALLHDAPEACVSDVPTPWKSQQAQENEDVLLERISLEHGLPWPWPEEVWQVIRDIDYRVLAAEAQVLEYPGPTDWIKVQPEHDIVEATKDMLHGCRGLIDPQLSEPLFRSHFIRALQRANR